MRTFQEFSKRQLNKWERQQLKKAKQAKRGRFTDLKAKAMSRDVGHPMYYMKEPNDINIQKKRIKS